MNDKNLKIIVFDMGGTLMQYIGMPLSWIEYYRQGFDEIIKEYNLIISQEMIEESVEILKSFNPRISKREIEYSPEYIFTEVLRKWNISIPVEKCIAVFWRGLRLKAQIYPDAIDTLVKLKEKGYIIGIFTDLPNAMPDSIFINDIFPLKKYIDYYVSSSVAGFRKPNSTGLKIIADKYSASVCELIFVGYEDKDEKTALNAGCRFIRINRLGKQTGSITCLYELSEIIE